MKIKSLGAVAFAAIMGASPALAEMVFPSLSYRTGAYAANGIPFADGYEDYFTLINERDGGIGGVKAKVIECETGYNTEKGVECYESTKGQGALVYQPLSRHYLSAYPEISGGWYPAAHDGIWPDLGGERQGVQHRL